MNLEIQMIRSIWALVEKSNPHSLLQLSDRELNQQLTKEIQKVFAPNSDDSLKLSKYIGSRVLLIRDLAYSKVDCGNTKNAFNS